MANWSEVQHWSPDQLRRYQNNQLAAYTREFLYPFSPFYRELFKKAGVTPEQIRTVDDLRRVPLTSKTDLIPTTEDPARFKKFILQPDPESIRKAWPLNRKLGLLFQSLVKGKPWVKEKLRKEFYPCFMTFTTGRSAEPVPFFYSSHDLDRLRVTGGRLADVWRTGGESFWRLCWGG